MKSKKIRIKCNFCGKEKYFFPYRIKRSKRLYCSLKCKKKDSSNLLIEAHKNKKFGFGITSRGGFIKGKKNPKLSKFKKELYKSNPELHPNRIMAKRFLKGTKGFISKPQAELFLLIKEKYSEAKLEYPIKTKHSIRFADIAIPSLKIDIEYDGSFWHQNKTLDNLRTKHLNEIGWKVIRFNKENVELCLNKLKEVN